MDASIKQQCHIGECFRLVLPSLKAMFLSKFDGFKQTDGKLP